MDVSASQQVLACDDEPHILRALTAILRQDGYTVLTAATMQAALDMAARSRIDAAIVDLKLPDGDGIELCRRLRRRDEMPIIVLSAIAEEEQKLAAFRAGADDYITKPFGPRELLARLAAALRRTAVDPEAGLIHAGRLDVDLAGHRVLLDAEEVHLTPLEFELLAVLVRNPGRVLTHRALILAVWGVADDEDTSVLRTHIARLRGKIDPPAAFPHRHIRTEPGIGFRFDPR